MKNRIFALMAAMAALGGLGGLVSSARAPSSSKKKTATTLTERDQWNADVDRRKDQKKGGKK